MQSFSAADYHLPVALALMQPGEFSPGTRLRLDQVLMSALLIHVTGGRIETHFHVFGSLAFLASIATGACHDGDGSSSRWTTSCEVCTGRKRSMGCWPPAHGGRWSMPAGSCLEDCFLFIFDQAEPVRYVCRRERQRS